MIYNKLTNLREIKIIDNNTMILTAYDKNNIKISIWKQKITVLQAKENKRV